METQARLISAAEQLFDRHGFTATGIDKLTQAAGMSSRTLYKHAGSKTALIAAVLAERERRFLQRAEVQSVDALFEVLVEWIQEEGSRGCLFLRAFGETGGDTHEIAEVVRQHKVRFLERIREIVARETGGKDEPALAEQILIVFEGATAAAVYRGVEAVATARDAAQALMERAQS